MPVLYTEINDSTKGKKKKSKEGAYVTLYFNFFLLKVNLEVITIISHFIVHFNTRNTYIELWKIDFAADMEFMCQSGWMDAKLQTSILIFSGLAIRKIKFRVW